MTNPTNPWTVSAQAVRTWQAILLRQPVVGRNLPAHLSVSDADARDFRRAKAWLEFEVVRVRESYASNPDKQPQQRGGHPNLYVYRGGLPLRLRLLVDPEAGEVVDVLSIDSGRNVTWDSVPGR